MKSVLKALNSIHNWFQILTSAFIIIFLVLNINKIDEQKEFLILTLRVIQIEQSLDIVFNLMTRGGGILSSVMQICGKNIVASCIIDDLTDNLSLSIVIICWNVADLIRYLYFTIKNKTLTYIRYNAFRVLYPIGVMGECLSVENRINRKDSFDPLFLRFLQIILVLGMLYLYRYLLKKSKEVFRKENEEKAYIKNE